MPARYVFQDFAANQRPEMNTVAVDNLLHLRLLCAVLGGRGIHEHDVSLAQSRAFIARGAVACRNAIDFDNVVKIDSFFACYRPKDR